MSIGAEKVAQINAKSAFTRCIFSSRDALFATGNYVNVVLKIGTELNGHCPRSWITDVRDT